MSWNLTKNLIHLTLLSILTVTSMSYANDSASIIVLDASGSMWKQLKNGRTKIETAREVVGDYLKSRNNDIPLGVIVYGHRRKGDCADIEVIAPVKTQNIAALTQKINQLTPKGKTPLTDALALAVKQIPRTTEEADIILITDGLETCGKDPCALAQKIADEGIKIRAHVVGFGLSEKEANSLSCIPNKTGGQLLRPQSGKALSEALQTVEKSIKNKPTQTNRLPIHIGINYLNGTARPTSIRYSAKNIKTGKIIELDKMSDTVEIMRGLTTKLPIGKWQLSAKGPQGEGSLAVTITENSADKSYSIPYQATKVPFSMKNLGPYQLGQEQSFLLNLGKPMQKNKTLSAELFFFGADNKKERLDWEYLIGLGKGIREINFKSPKVAGKYKILIINNNLQKPLESFDIEYVEQAQTRLKIPETVKPKERFAYELKGNWYRNNSLKLVQNGETISSTWLGTSIDKNGTFLTAPDKAGRYTIIFQYDDIKKKMTNITLGQLNVIAEDQTKPTQDHQGEYSAETAKAMQIEDQENSTPIGNLQGNWRLVANDSKGGLLARTQLIHNKGENKAQGTFILHNAADHNLGDADKDTHFVVSKTKTTLNIAFKTVIGQYSATLQKNDDAKFTALDYAEVWSGDMKMPNGAELSVYFGKINKAHEAKKRAQDYQTKTGLYDLKKDRDQLIFTCKKEKCVYDDPATGLKNIPLLKNWALTQPVYYATAGAGKSKKPSILFVDTNKGQWITLNPRLKNPNIVSCVEFGENGRLSTEESICYSRVTVNKEDKASSHIMTLLENIETWRDSYYQTKPPSPKNNNTKTSDTSKALSTTDQQLKSSLFSDGEVLKD